VNKILLVLYLELKNLDLDSLKSPVNLPVNTFDWTFFS